VPRINLLPAEIRSQQRQRRLLTVLIAIAAAILGVLVVVFLIQLGTINREEDELADLQAEQGNLSAQVAQLQQFGQLQADVTSTRASLQAALQNDIAWSKFLNDVSLIMPDNSWLASLSMSSAAGQAATGAQAFGTTQFQGFVFDFPGLAGWLTRMTQIDGLTFVYLSNGQKQALEGREIVSFGASASITESLLSRRCQEDKPCP
jgi:Tfp pilus assembly protein PilN